MKVKLIIILSVLISIKAFGQCTAIHHSSVQIRNDGDTINRINNNGFYYGKHIYWDNDKYLLNDTTSYIIGKYKNGKPIGLWINHCKNGTYSIGSYNSGTQITSDGNGSWTEKEQGIYAKVGEWKFFDSDSTLIKTETYERFHDKKGWTNKTYLKVNNDNVLIEYDYNNKRSLNSIFKVQRNYKYRIDKSIQSVFKRNFFKQINIQYYPNGQKKTLNKCRKFIGIKLNKSITKFFSESGDIIGKEKSKCWSTIE